jgi:hypothetical protein
MKPKQWEVTVTRYLTATVTVTASSWSEANDKACEAAAAMEHDLSDPHEWSWNQSTENAPARAMEWGHHAPEDPAERNLVVVEAAKGTKLTKAQVNAARAAALEFGTFDCWNGVGCEHFSIRFNKPGNLPAKVDAINKALGAEWSARNGGEEP